MPLGCMQSTDKRLALYDYLCNFFPNFWTTTFGTRLETSPP